MDDLNTMDVLEPSGEIQELYMTARAAVDELQRACGKFPTWPTQMTHCPPAAVSRELRVFQRINDGKHPEVRPTADTIFYEEYAEMCEAAQSGDLEAAKKEAIQAMAMLLRIYVHLPYYCALARGEVAHANCDKCGGSGAIPVEVWYAGGQRIGGYREWKETMPLCESCCDRMTACEGCSARISDNVAIPGRAILCPDCQAKEVANG
jgi:hypothetical protein